MKKGIVVGMYDDEFNVLEKVIVETFDEAINIMKARYIELWDEEEVEEDEDFINAEENFKKDGYVEFCDGDYIELRK